jgi:hypothetical protein
MSGPAPRPQIQGPVLCRVLDHDAAQGVEALSSFCCGQCGIDASAMEVNQTVGKLYVGGGPEQLGVDVATVILLLDEHDVLVGVSGMTVPAPNFGDVAFIQIYGREKRLKGYVLADGTTALGDALLRACIEVASHVMPGSDAPDAVAFTHWNNVTSHGALSRMGFELDLGEDVQGPQGGWHHRYTLPSGIKVMQDQQLWHRPAGLPLSPLPADVYIGPAQT